MPTDILTLGGLVFDDWSTPAKIGYGGKHAMAVHKLPGGSRVVDTLGPDDADIAWQGTLWGDGAEATAFALHALRQSGQTVPLAFGGQFFLVIVADAAVTWERYPNYATYTVVCLVVSSPMAGGLGAIVSTISTLASADMGSISTLASSAAIPAAISSSATALSTAITAAQPLASAATATVTTLANSATTLAANVESAIPTVAGALDSGVTATTGPEIATALTGIVSSSASQLELADMAGFAGRLASNLTLAA